MNDETLVSTERIETVGSSAQAKDEVGDLRFASRRTKSATVNSSVDTLLLYDRDKSNGSNIDDSKIGNGTQQVHHEKSNGNENEHSATTEASQSSESNNEDYRDNDNDSVYSDIASISSKHSKAADVRQYVRLLAKLKNENMLLKESLEKTNLTDIVTLKTSLRGARSDIIQLRQYNSELKDRVQVLEQRLFNALSNLNDSDSSEPSSNLTAAAAAAVVADSESLPLGRANQNEAAELVLRPWRSKVSHLTRLVKSYEKKIEEMELLIDSLRENKSNNNTSSSTDITTTTANNNSSNSSGGAVQRLQAKVTSLEAQRETDQRVIQQLTAELRDLQRQREDREREEEQEEGESISGTSNNNRTAGNHDGLTATAAAAAAASVVPSAVRPPPAVTAAASVGGSGRSSSAAPVYSSNQLMLSFVAGLVLMLLCSLCIK